jgi:hypothetical protein
MAAVFLCLADACGRESDAGCREGDHDGDL